MKLSTRSTYGLRLCVMIALSSEPLSASRLVKMTDISLKYLEQILLMLKKGGILTSIRGKSGGYTLARTADIISLKEILYALGDGFEIAECVSGSCGDEYCPNRKVLNKLYSGIDGILTSITLESMIEDLRCKKI